MVFPRAAFSEMMGWHGASDGLVEIWNGMPFFSPVWARRPTVAWLHHVHDTMWEMTLPPRLARIGRTIEFRIAPPLYRRVADRDALGVVEARARRPAALHGRRGSPSCRPASTARSRRAGRSRPTPLVVAVGRLVPVKRFDVLVDALVGVQARASRSCARSSSARATSATRSRRRSRELGAERWIALPGHVDDDELVDAVPAGVGRRERVRATRAGA